METKIITYYEALKLKHTEIQICRGFYGNINLPQSSNIAILKLHREVSSLIMYYLHKEHLWITLAFQILLKICINDALFYDIFNKYAMKTIDLYELTQFLENDKIIIKE